MSRARAAIAIALLTAAGVWAPAFGAEDVPVPAADNATVTGPAPVQAPPAAGNGLEALVPELASHPYHLNSGTRPYAHRLSLSPGYGSLGSEPLFTLRLAYNPSPWLGYEAALGHNPGQSVHAAIHSLNLVVRHPFPGRVQPYVTGGYGMVLVFPGQSVNADPVTKNALTYGGGLELYIRSDLAIRAEIKQSTVFGKQRDREGVVTYDYLQETIGLAFYRSIGQ